MTEEVRWVIDVVIGIVGLVIGYFGKTIQIRHSNKKVDKRSTIVNGDNNNVAGGDINNGTKKRDRN